MTISLDYQVHEDEPGCSIEELPLKITQEKKPFGKYHVPPIKPFVTVSAHRGVLGFYWTEKEALMWLRSIVRFAMWRNWLFDFRLYHWRPELGLWEVHLDHIDL